MKIILILSVLFCSQLLGVEYGEDLLSELEKYDINNADPNQTIKIVEKKEAKLRTSNTAPGGGGGPRLTKRVVEPGLWGGVGEGYYIHVYEDK